MVNSELRWPSLDDEAEMTGRILVTGVFEGKRDWTTTQYKNPYNALLGPCGARCLREATAAVKPVLRNHGQFELLAVSVEGEDELVITDGVTALLVSKREHSLSVWDSPAGAMAERLFRGAEGSRLPLDRLRGAN